MAENDRYVLITPSLFLSGLSLCKKPSRTLCVRTSVQAVLLGYGCGGWHAWAASFSCEDQQYLSCQHTWPSPPCT